MLPVEALLGRFTECIVSNCLGAMSSDNGLRRLFYIHMYVCIVSLWLRSRASTCFVPLMCASLHLRLCFPHLCSPGVCWEGNGSATWKEGAAWGECVVCYLYACVWYKWQGGLSSLCLIRQVVCSWRLQHPAKPVISVPLLFLWTLSSIHHTICSNLARSTPTHRVYVLF